MVLLKIIHATEGITRRVPYPLGQSFASLVATVSERFGLDGELHLVWVDSEGDSITIVSLLYCSLL